MGHVSTRKQLTFEWNQCELPSEDRAGLSRFNASGAGKPAGTAHSAFDAADIKGNDAAKRQLLVAAASGVPVRLEGPSEYVLEFRELAHQLGVQVRDDKQYRDFVVEIVEPTRRELDSRLTGTSLEEIRKALAEMSEQAPEQVDEGYFAVLEATIRTHHLDQRLTQLIQSVAKAIARLEKAEKVHPAHVAEAIDYVLLGDPNPEVPKPTPDAPPLVRPDRQLTFDGLPHWKWPKPKEAPDTITVDRVTSDIDGPAHRFVIQVGDTVEVFSTPSSAELAEVLDVFPKKRLVQVRFFDEKKDSIWISVGRTYPAPPASSKEMVVSERSPGDMLRTSADRTPMELGDSGEIGCTRPDSENLTLTSFAIPEGVSAGSLHSCPKTASRTLPISLAKPVAKFCQKIIERLSICSAPAHVEGDAISQLKWELRAILAPFPDVDESGAPGYQWPASRLTGDDMKRLRILANLSGLPCNEVLCVATRMLFCQTRSLMDAAVALHEESQTPLPELLDEISCHRR